MRMTRADFLRWAAEHTPWTPRPIASVPDAWLSAAQEVWARHLDYLGDICRDLGKLGGNLGEGRPSEYSRSLTGEEQVGLFLEIRDYAPWVEPCWRSWFERSFPESVGHLPSRLSPAEGARLEAESRQGSQPRDEPW